MTTGRMRRDTLEHWTSRGNEQGEAELDKPPKLAWIGMGAVDRVYSRSGPLIYPMVGVLAGPT